MRFAVAHKTASYLMVVCGLFGLLMGGGVAPPVALLAILGLVVSWWWEPPRVRLDRWALLWTIASVLALVWSGSVAVLTGDYFGAGSSFLVFLVIVKAFNRRSSRDWQQLYLLAFLMLVAGSVLNEDLTYAVAFLGFVISSTWALILSHLRREMEDNFLLKHADDRASERVEVRRILESRRIVGGRFFVGTGFVSLGVFALASLLFLLIPRVGAGFFMKGRKGVSFAGFKDGVKLGGHGTIKNDDTVVMRVQLSTGNYQYLHWRGASFDEYRDGEWHRSADDPRTSVDEGAPRTEQIDTLPAGKLRRRHVVAPGAGDVTDARLAHALKQTIWVEPMDTEVLFGASMPVAMEHAARAWRDELRRQYRERNDELRLDRTASIKYTVWSDVATPDENRLRAAPTQLPPRYELYLQRPASITARTQQLAEQITAGLTNNYDKARAIETWLSTQLAYTLELDEPDDGTDPVEFFLFDRKKGHCEYFASAFVMLVRTLGIPAREVNGFLGGEWNEYQDYIAVRAGDAHAWAEVYFPDVGWVTFDATPSSQDQLGTGGDGLRARFRRLLDMLKFQWTKWVIDYDLSRQLGLFKDIGGAFDDAGKWVKARWREAVAWAKRHWLLAILAGAAVLALLVWRALRRRRAAPSEPRSRPKARGPVAAIYTRVLHRLERKGFARAPAVTPRELARTAEERSLPYARQLTELTEIYYAAQWGGEDGLVDRARTLAGEIEASLSR